MRMSPPTRSASASRTGAGVLLLALLATSALRAQRIRDITRIEGIRSQHLTGVGLVIGLNGTGDSQQNVLMKKFYLQLIKNLGDTPKFDISDLKTRNTALVMVSSTVPSSLKVGSEFEVIVSSIGDAESLHGGYLLSVPLRGPAAVERDQGRAMPEYYAVAQGTLFSDGTEAKIRTAKGYAVLEQSIDTGLFLSNLEDLTLILNEPDYGTASRIAAKINEHDLFRDPTVPLHASTLAQAVDTSAVRVRIPTAYLKQDRVIDFLSQIMEVEVPNLDREALVAINRSTGAVVINGAVRVTSSALISYKGVMIRIPEFTPEDAPGTLADANPFERNPLLMDVIRVLERDELEFTGADIINILRQLQRAGAIIGKFVEE